MNNFKPVNGNWIQTIAYMLKDIDSNLSNEFGNVNNQLSASTDVIVNNFQTTNDNIEAIINQINLFNETNNIMLNSINGKLDEIIDKDCSPVINVECPAPIVNVNCLEPVVNVNCNCGQNKCNCIKKPNCNIHPQKPYKPNYIPLPCPPKPKKVDKPKECMTAPVKKHTGPIISLIDRNYLTKLNKARKIR
jgi:hypothetical protein